MVSSAGTPPAIWSVTFTSSCRGSLPPGVSSGPALEKPEQEQEGQQRTDPRQHSLAVGTGAATPFLSSPTLAAELLRVEGSGLLAGVSVLF